jgi:hypothetical protein
MIGLVAHMVSYGTDCFAPHLAQICSCRNPKWSNELLSHSWSQSDSITAPNQNWRFNSYINVSASI